MNIGKKPLSNEEYEEYLIKEKQKEAILERNKKIKKKENQEPIPFLDPIQQMAEGSIIFSIKFLNNHNLKKNLHC